MSLPPLTSHSKWKCLPEIHASRISVSGSLRPKLGLLILSVVLVVSLCFVLVPVITRLQASHQDDPVRPLPLSSLLTRLSLGSSQSVLISPSILLSSLTAVNASSQTSKCNKQKPSSSTTNITSIILVKKISRTLLCEDESVKVKESELTSEAINKHLRDPSIVDHDKTVAPEAVIVVSSDVNVTVPGTVSDESLVVTGQFQQSNRPEYMMVKLSDPEHELYLLQPHTDHKTLELTHNMLEELDTRDDLELVMPGSVVHSSLSLSPHLTSLGHHTLNIPVYHQSSLHFIPKVSHSLITWDEFGEKFSLLRCGINKILRRLF